MLETETKNRYQGKNGNKVDNEAEKNEILTVKELKLLKREMQVNILKNK